MVCEDTLKFRNFPECLSKTDKVDFLSHFGATEIKVIEAKIKRKSVAYAKFPSKEVAQSILRKLHQIDLFDSLLYVEYARNDPTTSSRPQAKHENDDANNKKHYNNFITRLNAFNNSVNFNQPPPNHLKYLYPKPNVATINNIAHALATIPKFYTQVLHLMNKMNLPPPFSNVPEPPCVQIPQEVAPVPVEESSESELESDPENEKNKEIIPVKRNLKQKKVMKRPKFIKPNVVSATENAAKDVGEVFETVELQQGKIEINVSVECLENKTNVVSESTTVETVVSSQTNEDNATLDKTVESTTELSENSEKSNTNDEANQRVQETSANCITEEELSSNRIPLKDLSVLAVFKDYHPGIPSTRLYIKNIAKSVEKSDLEFIYRRFVKKKGEGSQEEVFNVRLMQEGRMKGQAFVTMESVDVAQMALKETNGYILKDKPLVVVFGRSAANKK